MKRYELDTPVAIVDVDILERNISDMADFARGVGIQLRPHVKTHKVPEIARKQLSAGAVGITCAKLGEAEIMADIADDIFVANQIVGDDKIRRLLNLAQKKRISVGVDSVEIGQPISDSAIKRGLKIPVLIKIDVGLQRTGVPYGEPAVELARKLEKMHGLSLVGIYTHEGHVYNATDPEHLRNLALESGQRMVQTADMLRRSGFEISTVSVGATPSAKITCTVPGITESRPGTYVFNDLCQIKLGVTTEDNCALTILATVISVPSYDRAVIDAGTKCLTSDKVKDFGVYGSIKGLQDIALVRAYEEHGVLSVNSSKWGPKVGDRLEIIPNHVCPVVNLFDELVGVRGNNVEVVWKVSARGKVR